MSEQEVNEAEAPEMDAPALGEAGQDAPEAPARDWEAEAREMGWVPETEFNGPEGKWKDAQAFVEDGERLLPIVNSRLKKTQAQLDKERAEFEKKIARLSATTQAIFKRQQEQHKAEMERLRAAQREAVEMGDTARFDALERQRDALAASAPVEPEADDDAPKQMDGAAMESRFRSENDWYGRDYEMTMEAQRYSQFLAANGTSGEDNLRMTAEHVNKKFGKANAPASAPKRNGHAPVDAGSVFPARSGKRGFDSLPAEAKASWQQFEAMGVKISKEDYAKEYYANE